MYAFTYRTYYVSWWLTILLKEIKRQLVKASIFELTYPPSPGVSEFDVGIASHSS